MATKEQILDEIGLIDVTIEGYITNMAQLKERRNELSRQLLEIPDSEFIDRCIYFLSKKVYINDIDELKKTIMEGLTSVPTIRKYDVLSWTYYEITYLWKGKYVEYTIGKNANHENPVYLLSYIIQCATTTTKCPFSVHYAEDLVSVEPKYKLAAIFDKIYTMLF